MCGIAGAIENLESSNLDFSFDSAIHQTIRRRGPDSFNSRTLVNNQFKLTLAHSRLSIIDLTDASNQPFNSSDERFIVVFNGEIYNYIELRKELIEAGFSFSTQGDTEVLINAWSYWGHECLHKFNGMFAFALYDIHTKLLHLVRDRFGVKPLLYSSLVGGGIFFSSSIRASAVASKNYDLDLNYLSSGYYFGIFEGISNNSIYSSVKYLEAGTMLTIDLNLPDLSPRKYKWYDLNTQIEKIVNVNNNKSYIQLKEECNELLRNSVSIRLRSDVPVAVSLSGGVDSTIIASLAHSINTNIEGFNFGRPIDSNSEGVLVDLFAKHKGIKVNYISIDNTEAAVINAFEETFEAQELPFLGLSVVAQNQVYKRVNEMGIRVLLGGQGGDEIFAGYRKFFIQACKNSIYNRELFKSINLLYSLGNMMLYETKKFSLFWGFRNRYFNQEKLDIGEYGFLPFNQIDMIGDAKMSTIDRQILDVVQSSIPTLLRYEDRNSMYHSIESRLPMMDYRLVEFAIALPILYKIRNGFGKWILRDLYKDDIPREILFNKRKRGFDVTQNLMKLGLENYLVRKILDHKSNLENYDINVNDKKISEILKKTEHIRNNELLLLNYLTHKMH